MPGIIGLNISFEINVSSNSVGFYKNSLRETTAKTVNNFRQFSKLHMKVLIYKN